MSWPEFLQRFLDDVGQFHEYAKLGNATTTTKPFPSFFSFLIQKKLQLWRWRWAL
jgi:hypothetical protein